MSVQGLIVCENCYHKNVNMKCEKQVNAHHPGVIIIMITAVLLSYH